MLKKELDDLFKKLGKNKNKVAILNKILKYASDNNANYKEVILALQDAKNVNLFKQAQAMELEQSGGVNCFGKKCSSRVYITKETEETEEEDLIKLEKISKNTHPKYNTTNPQSMYNEILRIMESYKDDENIQILGFKTLNDPWTLNYPWNNILNMENGIEVVVAAMNNHLYKANIQESGFYFLQKIVDSCEKPRNTINILVSAGGIKAIVAVMDAHLNNAIIQESGCLALANITAADETKWKVLRNITAKVLRNITANADEIKRKVVDEGGIKAVVAAMNAYLNNATIQIRGCAALGNIAALAENQPKVAAAKGIEAVVAAMEAHLKYADVQEYLKNAVVQENGCRALRNIAALAENQPKVAAAKGIEAVVAAMRRYPKNIEIQQQGYSALWNIADDGEIPPSYVSAPDDIEAVMAIMKMHLNNAAVQENGCWSLMKIKFENNTKFSEVETVMNAVVAAMNEHLNNAIIQEYGCMILMRIAVLAENKPKVAVAVVNAGGIEAVVAAMKVHTGVAVIQKIGCAALAHIAGTADENRLKVAAAGGIEAVVAAMNTHTRVATIQEYGCWALSNIAVLADNQLKVAAEGGIKAVVAAMNEHLNNALVQKNGCAALQSITNNNMNTLQFIDISVLESIIDRYPAELKNILDGISIDEMIKIKTDFINNNEDTLSCEKLLKNIRYFDDHIYENRTVTNCGHVFHTTCLKPWIRNHDTCPNCRKKLKKDGGNSEDECSICHDNLENENLENENRVIINKDRFNTVSASYYVFIKILKRCNDDAELKPELKPELIKRIDGYKPKAGPSNAIAGGKKKQLKSKKKMI